MSRLATQSGGSAPPPGRCPLARLLASGLALAARWDAEDAELLAQLAASRRRYEARLLVVRVVAGLALSVALSVLLALALHGAG